MLLKIVCGKNNQRKLIVSVATVKGNKMGDEGIHGFPDSVFYQYYFFGGSENGYISNGFRPYFRIITPEGNIYEAKEPHKFEHEYIEWVDDGTRRIDLFFKGRKKG